MFSKFRHGTVPIELGMYTLLTDTSNYIKVTWMVWFKIHKCLAVMRFRIKERIEEKPFHKFLVLLNSVMSFTWFLSTLKWISPLSIYGICMYLLGLGLQGKGQQHQENIRGNHRNHRPLTGQRIAALSSASGCQRPFSCHLLDAAQQYLFKIQCFVQSVYSAACAQ